MLCIDLFHRIFHREGEQVPYFFQLFVAKNVDYDGTEEVFADQFAGLSNGPPGYLGEGLEGFIF